jgi:hypothetical protein
MHKQEWIERPAFDSASTWSYSVLVLTLALVAHAWTTAQPNLDSPQRLISPASLPEETFKTPSSNGAHRLVFVKRAETEGSLETPFPTTESETPTLSPSFARKVGPL